MPLLLLTLTLTLTQVIVPLCPMMDARTHSYTLDLADPEGISAAEGGVKGSVTFELSYLS